jgi:hypothetical protein
VLALTFGDSPVRDLLPETALLQPALALVCWTLAMWIWMYATRIPAIRKAQLDPHQIKQPSDLNVLPMSVRQVADNYNHLHEQPTLFYALVMVATLAGTATDLTLWCAWTYVALRVIHSLYQSLGNFVLVRFPLFVLASVPVFLIAGEQALALFA